MRAELANRIGPARLRFGIGAFGLLALLAATTPSALAVAPGLRLVHTTPGAGTGGVPGTSQILLRFNEPVALTGGLPRLEPPLPGTWRAAGRLLVFTPTGAYAPDQEEQVVVPGGSSGVAGNDGTTLPADREFTFHVAGGTMLRAQQLLAALHYLPVAWRGSAPHGVAFERAVFDPPLGRFVFDWDAPQPLRVGFVIGVDNLVTSTAISRFELVNHLPPDGVLTGRVWSALLAEGRRPVLHANPGGYTYALASKTPPEMLKIWQGGRLVVNSPANTGIPEAPTADGTWAVYARLKTQVMKGTTPSGTKYADPVSYVEYFNGSDAVHYIDRSSFGYQQSLGCVEVPLSTAEQAWNHLQLATLITVEG